MNEYLRPYIMRRFIIPGSIVLVIIVGAIVYFMPARVKTQHTPSAQAVAVAAPPTCVIKGNINEKGERIYHVPADPWYSKTKLDLGKGERWFCSEKEAQAAGWRAPGK